MQWCWSNFGNCKLVVPRVPIAYFKVGPRGRQVIPAWILVLRKYIEANVFGGPHGLHCIVGESQRECIMCHHAVQHGIITPHIPLLADLYDCSRCLQSWHYHCSQFTAAANPVTELTWNGAEPFVCPVCVADDTSASSVSPVVGTHTVGDQPTGSASSSSTHTVSDQPRSTRGRGASSSSTVLTRCAKPCGF